VRKTGLGTSARDLSCQITQGSSVAIGTQATSARCRRDKGSDRLPPLCLGLFAGIGGIELGFHRAGITRSYLRERSCGDRSVGGELPRNPASRRRVHAEAAPEGTTLVTAGFPCQDLSQAG